ncbi:hypothetical protein GTP44_25905 [Duganella sp. FT50W]|uniref:Uncharacterized protein n=1 Tax=Duganella lactea TaxID=2692173 RepID=A0A6L8MTL6_9BURK|nr:hypothetical protein [Duganella lactea]MYM32735.1 hypothetical protein [Duganella lactea]MYM85358.1 hypothetical protein [Duganella lactea]
MKQFSETVNSFYHLVGAVFTVRLLRGEILYAPTAKVQVLFLGSMFSYTIFSRAMFPGAPDFEES